MKGTFFPWESFLRQPGHFQRRKAVQRQAVLLTGQPVFPPVAYKTGIGKIPRHKSGYRKGIADKTEIPQLQPLGKGFQT